MLRILHQIFRTGIVTEPLSDEVEAEVVIVGRRLEAVVTWSQEVFKSGTGFIGTRARTFVLNRGVSEIGIRFNVHFFIFPFFVAPLRRPIGQAETLPAALESGE